MHKVQVWTDGSSDCNTREGGWGAILALQKNSRQMVKVIGGYAPDTTNNAMETWGVLGALEQMYKPCQVTINTDSQYVVFGLSRITSGRDLLKTNTSIWQLVQNVYTHGNHKIMLEKVQGHAENDMNNLADSVAVYCRKQKKTVEMLIEKFDPEHVTMLREHINAGQL